MLRALVDAQLPPALARYLSANGLAADHVVDLGWQAKADTEIWREAQGVYDVLVSKDEDFVTLAQLKGPGPCGVDSQRQLHPRRPAGLVCAADASHHGAPCDQRVDHRSDLNIQGEPMRHPPSLLAVSLLALVASTPACTAPQTNPESAVTTAPTTGFVTDLAAFDQFIATTPTPAQFRARYRDVTLVLPGDMATKELRMNKSRYFAELDGAGRITGGKFQ